MKRCHLPKLPLKVKMLVQIEKVKLILRSTFSNTYSLLYLYNMFIQEGETSARKQKLITLPRSDSIGSSSGRKFLAPTLSDPAARTEKERITTKKKNSRQTGNYKTS